MHPLPESGDVIIGRAMDCGVQIDEPSISRQHARLHLGSEVLLETDRTWKLALYARAGIAQYVIVNLCDSVIEVYEEPVAAKGVYARTSLVRAGATVALRTGEARALAVDAGRILP